MAHRCHKTIDWVRDQVLDVIEDPGVTSLLRNGDGPVIAPYW